MWKLFVHKWSFLEQIKYILCRLCAEYSYSFQMKISELIIPIFQCKYECVLASEIDTWHINHIQWRVILKNRNGWARMSGLVSFRSAFDNEWEKRLHSPNRQKLFSSFIIQLSVLASIQCLVQHDSTVQYVFLSPEVCTSVLLDFSDADNAEME